MRDGDVFRKTEAGREEIRDRGRRLPPALRTVLLMVDGQRPVSELKEVIAGTGSDMYSAICGGIGALRGPKHGGANEVAFEVQKRYETPDEAEADIRARVERKEVIIGFGHATNSARTPAAASQSTTVSRDTPSSFGFTRL